MLLVSKLQNRHRKACHAGGRGFESRPVRHYINKINKLGVYIYPDQLPRLLTENA